MASRSNAQSTRLIHSAKPDPASTSPLTLPIYETTTFVFDDTADLIDYNEGRSAKYLYLRYSNPTVAAVETALAALDGAEQALLFSSGMAAVTATLMTHVSAGDEVVCSASIYGGTLHLLNDVLTRFGVRPRFVPIAGLARPADVLGPATKLLWFETPTNPTLRCVEIRGIADACRARGVISVVDNTFATPINQRPLDLGIDLSMQSATKYLNGHSDVTAGVVSGSSAMVDPVEQMRRRLGAVMDPYPAYALGRGLKTLALRVERHNASAQRLAEFLAGDRRITRVYYPGLPSHPEHAIASEQMSGFGGMVCFDLGGEFDRAARTFDRFQVIKRAASLGGIESLVSMPVLTSQWGFTDAQLEEAGVTRGMLRLSVGLEDVDDLLADVEQALA